MTDYSNNPNDPASTAYARIEADIEAHHRQEIEDARDAGLAINAALYAVKDLHARSLCIIAETIADELCADFDAARHWSPIWTQAEADYQAAQVKS